MHVFCSNGFYQNVIPHPIYHMNHDVVNSAKFQISESVYLVDIARMLETGTSKERSEDWGFPAESFQEIAL